MRLREAAGPGGRGRTLRAPGALVGAGCFSSFESGKTQEVSSLVWALLRSMPLIHICHGSLLPVWLRWKRIGGG